MGQNPLSYYTLIMNLNTTISLMALVVGKTNKLLEFVQKKKEKKKSSCIIAFQNSCIVGCMDVSAVCKFK
jgi:hypothetical protein